MRVLGGRIPTGERIHFTSPNTAGGQLVVCSDVRIMSHWESGGAAPNLRSAARRRGQDLDLRLGRSKSGNLVNTRSSVQAVTIVVEDDDDDVQVFSPRSVTQQARTFADSRRQRVPVLDDEDLELRLGLAGIGTTSRIRSGTGESQARHASLGLPLNAAIDLTSANDDCEELAKTNIGKRKHAQSTRVPPKELKLTCAICMDTMKEETSTVCGHIFCRDIDSEWRASIHQVYSDHISLCCLSSIMEMKFQMAVRFFSNLVMRGFYLSSSSAVDLVIR